MKAHRTFACIAVAMIAVGAVWAADQGVVNINDADTEQLMLLSGVGPVLAERIIEFRDANGPFQSTEELVAVKGIGDKTLERLLPYLTVEGQTTLETKVRMPRTTGSVEDGS